MKRGRSLIRSRRGGVSIAIAILMSMVVVVSLVQNIYIKNQYVTDEDRERLQENISIELIFFDVDENLVIAVRNTGAVDSKIVAVWVEPVNSTLERRFTLLKIIESDQTREIKIENSTLHSFVSMTDEFSVTVFTERGNLVCRTYTFIEPSPIDSSSALGPLGIFRVDWFYCRYSSLQTPLDPVYGAITDAMFINKSEDYVAFYLKLRNAWDHPCEVKKESFLALTSIAPPQGGGEPNFFIVQDLNYSVTKKNPVITPYNEELNPIVLYPEQTATIVFAAESIDAATMWRWGFGYPFASETKTEGSGIQATFFFEIYDYDSVEKHWVPSGIYSGQTISTQAIILNAI